MPKPCQFSEFSYGYAVTEECVRRYASRVREAPRFPTLREERILAYDVHIAGFLYFQFKRPSLITGHRAREKEEDPPDLRGNVYRMPLYSDGAPSQHDQLMELEREVNRSGRVFYASPCFHTRVDFDTFYMDRTLLNNSLLVRPRAIGPLSADRHRLSYNRACFRTHAWRYSDPKQVEAVSLEGFEAEINKLADGPDLSAGYLTQLFYSVSELVGDQGALRLVPGGISEPRLAPVARLANLVRRAFGVEMLVIGKRKRHARGAG